MPETASASIDWPGKRLGLPERGPRSVARLGRRLAAIAIDWAISVLFSYTFFAYDPLATLLIFVIIQVLFVPTIGGSIGHRLVGVHVVPVAGGYIGVWRPFVRAVLIALVIPAVIWDRDQRGLHDRLIGTILLRR